MPQFQVGMFAGTGTGATGAVVVNPDPQRSSTTRIQVKIAATATVQFEATIDGTNWEATEARNEGTGATGTSTTASGLYTIDSSGFQGVRAYPSASTGAVTITGSMTWGAPGGATDVTLDASDVEIGAVEIKDATTDTRAKVGAGTGAAAGDIGLAVNLAGENHLGEVGGNQVATSATFARPNNGTAYTAGDVVSNSTVTTVLMAFANAARKVGGSGRIVKARLLTDLKTHAAQMRLYLFTVAETGVSVPVDNLPMTTIYADRAKRLGYIDFPITKDDADAANSTGAYAEAEVLLDFVAAVADTVIYGLLVDQTGVASAALQNFYVELTINRD